MLGGRYGSAVPGDVKEILSTNAVTVSPAAPHPTTAWPLMLPYLSLWGLTLLWLLSMSPHRTM